MKKAEELYMKHIYATGEIPNKRETSTSTEIRINEVDSPQRPGDYSHRRWRNRESSKILPNQGKFQRQPWKTGGNSKISPNQSDYQRQNRNMQNKENRQLPRGLYTQIMVNPTQLSDKEFAAWMDRLVEARRNRQENKPRPYRQFRKPFLQRGDGEETQ